MYGTHKVVSDHDDCFVEAPMFSSVYTKFNVYHAHFGHIHLHLLICINSLMQFCVCACVRGCVGACVRACARACVCVCV